MEFKNLICANCGGTDFQKLSDLEYRCNHCHGLLVSTTKPMPVAPVVYQPPPVTEFKMPEIPGFAKVIAITLGVILVVVCIALFARNRQARPVTVARTPTPVPASPTPTPTPPNIKVEVAGKASDRFGDSFIRYNVTNLSDVVIVDPYVRITIYKNDVKMDTTSGNAKLKYLKPGVTVPVLVSVGNFEGYTRAEVLPYEVIQSIPNADGFFPQFKYIDVAMKVETGISTFNDQPYKEKFYEVSGTIENDRYDKAKPTLFVIFYNAKNEIVGAETANPAEMKRGEKSSFEASAGDTQLMGTPVRYEIMAVDTSMKSSGPCAVNKIC